MAKKRFLIVEDHDTTSAAVADYLRVFFPDWDFSQAATEQAALEKTLQEKPDVVILDIALPDGDGLDIIRRVAKSTETQKPRFVVMTALGNQATHGPRPGSSWMDQLEPEERKLVYKFFKKPFRWKDFLIALTEAGGVPVPPALAEFQDLI